MWIAFTWPSCRQRRAAEAGPCAYGLLHTSHRLSAEPISHRKTDLVNLLSTEFCNGSQKPGETIAKKFRSRARTSLMRCAKPPKTKRQPEESMPPFWNRLTSNLREHSMRTRAVSVARQNFHARSRLIF